jgi:hypothetical protein
MELLMRDTSQFGDPLRESWHGRPSYTASFPRRLRVDASVSVVRVLCDGAESTKRGRYLRLVRNQMVSSRRATDESTYDVHETFGR